MTKVTLIGGATGREHAFAKQFGQSSEHDLSAILWAHNPYVEKYCSNYNLINLDDIDKVFEKIRAIAPDYVVVGQGEVSQRGIRNLCNSIGIPCIAPTKEMAKIEGSKSFFRKVLESIDPTLIPRYEVFTQYDERIKNFMNEIDNGNMVVKCDGTISGPRVRIYSTNNGFSDALADANEWIKKHGKIVVEEFIKGNEIAITSYTDGRSLVHSPPFRNHKRIFDNDQGENTSGMGTLTTGKRLSFMTDEQVDKLHKVTSKLFNWIKDSYDQDYLGCLYGEFLINQNDIKVIEYNCRFGNPSSMNLFELLEKPVPKLCDSIVTRTLHETPWKWSQKVSLSAYAVPSGFPYSMDNIGKPVDISRLDPDLFYCANMDFSQQIPRLKKSRAFAICATASTVEDVRKLVYSELEKVNAPIYARKDLGLIL